MPGSFGSDVQLTETIRRNVIPMKVSNSTKPCCNGQKNRLPGFRQRARLRVKMENWIFCFVFLAASSSEVPATDDAAEIQCDHQASATNGSGKENAVVSTTRYGMNHAVIILAR